MNEVRCPQCGRKLIDHLEDGYARQWCRQCKRMVEVDRRKVATIN